MRLLPAIALIVSSTVLFAGCKSTPLNTASTEDHSKDVVHNTNDEDNRSIKTDNDNVQRTDMSDAAVAERSVYFDFDSYIVKDKDQRVVEANSKYLTSHKMRKVIIQGNTDERGGNEYNLALGQKRAEAVRKSLAVLGVSDSQMEAVSLGKTKPVATGNDEEAWAQNRRADIVYQN